MGGVKVRLGDSRVTQPAVTCEPVSTVTTGWGEVAST